MYRVGGYLASSAASRRASELAKLRLCDAFRREVRQNQSCVGFSVSQMGTRDANTLNDVNV